MSPSRLAHVVPLRWRALLCALTLVVLGLGGAVGGPFGPGPASAATPAATPAAGDVLVQVTAIEPQVLQPAQDLVVTATIRNESHD